MLRKILFIGNIVKKIFKTCFLKSTETIKKQLIIYRKSIEVIY